VPLDRIKVVQGDTDRVPTGNGTGGFAFDSDGAVMVTRASQTLRRLFERTGRRQGWKRRLTIWKSPTAISASPARTARFPMRKSQMPGAKLEKLKAIESFTPPDATYPNGTHTCEVEIDPDTGAVRIERYTVVDD